MAERKGRADMPLAARQVRSGFSEPAAPTEAVATWPARALALVIDIVPGTTVVLTSALAAMAVPSYGFRWWLCVVVAAAALACGMVNRTAPPAVIGSSLGRACTGITVVRSDGAAVSPPRLLTRDVAHLFDTASVGVGWLWPLWDERGRTFADLLTGTEVRSAMPGERPPNVRLMTALVFLVTALISLIPGSAAYSAYHAEHTAMRVRAEITAVGPRIVEELLSYTPESLAADFARARTLVTQRYREQLVPQQEVIESGPALTNQYWVANSAVLSAGSRTARMLVFLQGQRGNAEKERLLSATVDVTFAKSGSRWLVDDLVVVNKPLPTEGAPAAGDGGAGEGER